MYYNIFSLFKQEYFVYRMSYIVYRKEVKDEIRDMNNESVSRKEKEKIWD